MTFPAGKFSSAQWLATNGTQRDAIGLNDALRVNDFCTLLSDGSRYICASVDGADASTWTDYSVVGPTTTGFAETALITKTHAVRTTDATADETTIVTFTADGQHCTIVISARGQEEGTGNILSQTIRQTFYRVSGSVSSLTAHENDTKSSGTVTGWAVTIVSPVSDTYALSIKGAAGTNIRWAATYSVQFGGANAS